MLQNLPTIRDLVQDNFALGASSTSTGFYSTKCAVCGDYKPRMGVKFDGDNIIINCFNCGLSVVHTEGSGKISRRFRSTLNAFGIDDTVISSIINSAFFKSPEKSDNISLASLQEIDTHTPTTDLPAGAVLLKDSVSQQAEVARDYLLSRCIDLDRYNFYISDTPRFKNRVIVPFFRNGRLIYWTARSTDPSEKNRWDNCPESRRAVLFNIDKLMHHSQAPLLVAEGVFDAMIFDGIALLGSKLSDAKIKLLQDSRRPLCFVIDKDQNGAALAREVLTRQLGSISFTPSGTQDINDSTQRYGRLWTAQQIFKNKCQDPDWAELAIRAQCT